jgi:hypothetical protein
VADVTNKTPGKEEEPSFRVTDRRRVAAEGAEGAARPPDSQAEGTPEPPHPPKSETPPPETDLTISDLVRIFILELQTRALIHMGLVPNPATRLVAKDLSQARLAINSMAALIEQLSPLATATERDELQQLLASLRLHFVRQTSG